MRYILDNFRQELKDFSVDIQDVVRSAILDDVDITPYIFANAKNPYKLDQYRLALKEGMSVENFHTLSGEVIYQLRQMKREGVDLQGVDALLKYNLSGEHIKYMLKWLRQGINLRQLNISLIPIEMLGVFDTGLSIGVDMSVFLKYNKWYSVEYMQLCLKILANGFKVDFLLKDKFQIECVAIIEEFSRSARSLVDLSNGVDSSISPKRLKILVKFLKSRVAIAALNNKDVKTGEYQYDTDSLALLWEAYKSGLDYLVLMECQTYDEMVLRRDKMLLAKKRKVSGRLTKN